MFKLQFQAVSLAIVNIMRRYLLLNYMLNVCNIASAKSARTQDASKQHLHFGARYRKCGEMHRLDHEDDFTLTHVAPSQLGCV